MARLIMAIPCQRIIIDQPTGLESCIDILDGIGVTTLPMLLPATIMATFWERESDLSVEAKIRIYSPEGQQISESIPVSIDLRPENQRCRLNFMAPPVLFQTPGKYAFTIEHHIGNEWVEVHRFHLLVELVQPIQQSPQHT